MLSTSKPVSNSAYSPAPKLCPLPPEKKKTRVMQDTFSPQWTKKARRVDLKPLPMHLNSSESGQRQLVISSVHLNHQMSAVYIYIYILCVYF